MNFCVGDQFKPKFIYESSVGKDVLTISEVFDDGAQGTINERYILKRPDGSSFTARSAWVTGYFEPITPTAPADEITAE